MVTRRDCSAITKKTRYRWNPTSVSTSTVNRSQAVRPSQGACMPVVVPDPLHRGPSDLVAEVRERPADPCVPPPLGILGRHPDHERGHVTSRHRPASTAAGAAVVCLGDQSPVPAENRVRRDDAGDLHHDAPSALLASHGESTAVGIDQAAGDLQGSTQRSGVDSVRRARVSAVRTSVPRGRGAC